MNRYELVTSILLVICLCLSYFDLCCWSFQLAALLTSASVLSNLVAIGVAAGFGCCRGSAERAENRLLPLAAEILDWPQWNDSAAWHCVLMTFYQSLRIQLKFDICTHKWSHLCRLHECMEYQAIHSYCNVTLRSMVICTWRWMKYKQMLTDSNEVGLNRPNKGNHPNR